MKTQSALPWFGSDSEIAEQLAERLDDCRHVTIPFCGGLGILPFLKATHIVANDRHELAINFYRYASGCFQSTLQRQLFERCQKTLSHPDEMRLALQILTDPTQTQTVSSAWAFWALCWLGRKGQGGTKHQGGKPSIRRTPVGGSNASRLRSAADDLLGWAELYRRCEWENDCFRVVIPKVANKLRCGIYIDAPWVGPGEDYLHGFGERDHRDLRGLLGRFTETTVLVRYGDAPLIRELYQDWSIEEAVCRNQANKETPELWITNKAQK